MLDLYENYDSSLYFDNLEYWWLFIVIGIILACLLLANVLIQVIKPLKKALIPSPVLGGFILLIFLSVFKAITGHALFNSQILEMITYHGLGIGFVASALKKKTAAEKEAQSKSKSSIFDSSLVTVGGYLVQVVIGLIVSITLFFIIGSYPASGALLPMGYGQGPGQALNWGINYETKIPFTLLDGTTIFFTGGTSFGLAIAAMGFISASIGGLIYILIQKKKGNVKFMGVDGEDVPKDNLETFVNVNDIPHSGTIDKLSVQIAIVVLTYLISFGIIMGVSALCDIDLQNGLASGKYWLYTENWQELGLEKAEKTGLLYGTIKPLMWGFNFIIGTGVAVGVKALLNGLTKAKAVKKEYINNYMMDRISGVAFDIMVVAAIGSIDLEAFSNINFVLPLLLMGVLGCVGTYFYCEITCNHLFTKGGYQEESFLSLFGMLTGTASTGVILLREIDPSFKTPALNNMVFQTLWSVALGAPVLLLMSNLGSGFGGFGLFACLAIFIVYFAIIMALIFRDKIKAKFAKK